MNKTLFKGAAYLTVAGVLCKVLGAFYRVPLTAVLGAEGLGIYQLAFPFYCILLTLSSTGIPAALSKLIAEGKDAQKVLRKSLLLFGSIGLALSLSVFFTARFIASAQGNIEAAGAYRALAPSVFFVSVLSCVRGYCQGKKNTLPTAVTQLTEQTVKLVFGLTLCSIFGSTAAEKAAYATLAVTISEAAAVVAAAFFYKKNKISGAGEPIDYGSIVKIVFPITLSAIMIPLSKTVDGFMVINLLNVDKAHATALYGLYSGAAESVISLPVALCYSFAVVAVPEISADKNNLSKRFDAVYYTLAVGAISGFLTYVFAPLAVKVLYGGLRAENAAVLVSLIRIACAQVFGLSLIQTCGATLTSLDKYYIPPLCLAFGIAAKAIFSYYYLPTSLGIYTCALVDSLIYVLVAAAEFVWLAVITIKKERSVGARKLAV